MPCLGSHKLYVWHYFRSSGARRTVVLGEENTAKPSYLALNADTVTLDDRIVKNLDSLRCAIRWSSRYLWIG